MAQKEAELDNLELQITKFKREIDQTLTRFYSDPWSSEKLWDMRMQLAEISLKNCRAITKYVQKASPPPANELEMRRRSVARKLRIIEKTRDIRKLDNWYKKELAPFLNKAEQTGYLVAMMARKALGDDGKPFTWQLQEPPAVEEHVKLYGKRAEQFVYLDQTCPICGGRIDEKGWCGCGTIGGG